MDGLIAGWVVASVGAGRSQAYSLPVRVRPLGSGPPDPLDVFFPHGPATAVLEPRPVPTPDLDRPWLASLGDLAPAGTAAMVLVYGGEEIDDAYTVDPVPPLPEWMTAGSGGVAMSVAGAKAAGSAVAARLHPVTAVVAGAATVYGVVEWLAPDAEQRQDTTAIFDVEYRDASGTVLDVQTNMAVLRDEVNGPLVGGPAIVVLPNRPPEED